MKPFECVVPDEGAMVIQIASPMYRPSQYLGLALFYNGSQFRTRKLHVSLCVIHWIPLRSPRKMREGGGNRIPDACEDLGSSEFSYPCGTASAACVAMRPLPVRNEHWSMPDAAQIGGGCWRCLQVMAIVAGSRTCLRGWCRRSGFWLSGAGVRLTPVPSRCDRGRRPCAQGRRRQLRRQQRPGSRWVPLQSFRRTMAW